jgi:hypothetical protein
MGCCEHRQGVLDPLAIFDDGLFFPPHDDPGFQPDQRNLSANRMWRDFLPARWIGDWKYFADPLVFRRCL